MATNKKQNTSLKDLQDHKYKDMMEDKSPIKKGTSKEEVKPLPNYIDTKRFDTIESKVTLSDKERNESARELAHKRDQRNDVEVEMKQHQSSYKDRIKEIDSQMQLLTTKANLGYEYRKFRCVIHLDFIRKVRIYKDHETLETIQESPIQPDDYQLRMPI